MSRIEKAKNLEGSDNINDKFGFLMTVLHDNEERGRLAPYDGRGWHPEFERAMDIRYNNKNLHEDARIALNDLAKRHTRIHPDFDQKTELFTGEDENKCWYKVKNE